MAKAEYHRSGEFKNDHWTADCPWKTDVSAVKDEHPSFIHGCILGEGEAEPVEILKDAEEYRRTLWVSYTDGGATRHEAYELRTEEDFRLGGIYLEQRMFYAPISEDGTGYVIVNLDNVKNIVVERGWEQ